MSLEIFLFVKKFEKAIFIFNLEVNFWWIWISRLHLLFFFFCNMLKKLFHWIMASIVADEKSPVKVTGNSYSA